MSTSAFLKNQLDTVGKQLQSVFNEFPESKWDEKATPVSFSAAETAEHLAECYQAFLVHAEGNDYEWGTYQIEDKSPENLVKTMFDQRAKATAVAASSEDPKIHNFATDYILLHDAYHVGQIVTLRLTIGDFDPYSLYR